MRKDRKGISSPELDALKHELEQNGQAVRPLGIANKIYAQILNHEIERRGKLAGAKFKGIAMKQKGSGDGVEISVVLSATGCSAAVHFDVYNDPDNPGELMSNNLRTYSKGPLSSIAHPRIKSIAEEIVDRLNRNLEDSVDMPKGSLGLRFLKDGELHIRNRNFNK